jgi:hypothetical protein
MMHGYADYGEGNFYELRRLEKTSRNSWHADIAIGIDTVPEASQSKDETIILRLTQSKLTISTIPAPPDRKNDRQLQYKLHRCSFPFKGLYRRNA